MLFRSALIFMFLLTVRNRNDPRAYILPGVAFYYTSEASSNICTTAGAGVACCIFGGQVIILPLLVRELSSSSLLGGAGLGFSCASDGVVFC